MPTVITQGAASAKGYGFGARATAANYIEDVFSTYLYTGTGASQIITNGIDLSGKGGLVWMKGRSGATDHALYDTARGAIFDIASNLTTAQTTQATGLTAFGATGFTIGSLAKINTSSATYASWTFRKQAKFFDVVTYTGNGLSSQAISHSLASIPGFIAIKRTNSTGDWVVIARSSSNGQYYILQNAATPFGFSNTNAAYGTVDFVNSGKLSSTNFLPYIFGGGNSFSSGTNISGATYVAYLFAHNAGGFGATGTDNVISCGSLTCDGSGNATVTLGYEPQWLLIKRTDTVGDWFLLDSMRGIVYGTTIATVDDRQLSANTTSAEVAVGLARLNSNGFDFNYAASAQFIYIAIRRGPMRTPATGTSVFGLSARTGTGANATVTGGQTDDAILIKNRANVAAVASLFSSRLTGTGYMATSDTAAELAAGTTILQANPWDVMDGVKLGTTSTTTNASTNTFINYLFRRAPGFFDVVCYTGTGVATTVSHNLGVVPEFWIVKARSFVSGWYCGSTSLANSEYIILNQTNGKQSNSVVFNSTYPTASVFSVGNAGVTNNNGSTYVAYLFATVAGVSKIGTYTGNGTNQTINCGFTGGARFILIKRTDTTGDWYVWDTARGIVAGNDPHISLNTTAVEVTTDDSIDTASTGFIVNQLAATDINVNTATYIFLAIA